MRDLSNLMHDAEISVLLPNGIEFYLPSRKMRKAARFLTREIFKKRRYWRKGFEIKETDTIIDIGSNMGLFVMWTAPQASKGRVIAVEPTESIDVLDMNLKKNDIKNVKTIRAAIGPDGRNVEIITYPGFNVINHQTDMKPTFFTKMLVRLLTGQWKSKTVIETVPAISLGSIIDSYDLEKIDLLKIEAEGCEFELFRSISDKHLDKIEKIAMGFHEYRPENKHQELVSILEARGYKVKVEKPLIDYYLVGKCGFIWAQKN